MSALDKAFDFVLLLCFLSAFLQGLVYIITFFIWMFK